MNYIKNVSNEVYITTTESEMTKEEVKAMHEPNMEGKRKISREFQVTEADGNLMWFDTTSKGLKEAIQCFLKAETEYNNMPEDEQDCIPCIELYERFMIYDCGDWEVDNFNHLQLHQKMPTKAIQRIVDRVKNMRRWDAEPYEE